MTNDICRYAEDFGRFQIVPLAELRGYCELADREIAGPDLALFGDDPIAWAIWYHELGHANPNGRHRYSSEHYRRNPIPSEVRAWEWAIANCPEWDRSVHEYMLDDLYTLMQSRPAWNVESNRVLLQKVEARSGLRLLGR